jgi:hypothetical protein
MDDFKEIKDLMMSSMTKASSEDVTMIDTTASQNLVVEQE